MFKAFKNVDRKDRKGFSLVELLVVLLIMSIVAGIAVPLYLNQKQRSYLALAQSDATAIGKEFTSILSDYTNFGTNATTATCGTWGDPDCRIDGSGTVGAYVLTFGPMTAATGSGTFTTSGPGSTGALRISTGSSVTSANYGQLSPSSSPVWCLIVTNNGTYAKYTNAGLVTSQIGGTALTCVTGS